MPLELIHEAPGGDFQVSRDVYRDPEVFELEMAHIFEASWNLVGLEAQLPRPYDFITTSIGRTPVIVSRDGAGRVHANVNSCRHKGALVCHRERGSARTFVCQYHGWAYDASGRNVHIKGKDEGAYPEAFDALEHDLQPVARLGTYRGFIFASLSPDVPALEDYLGDFRRFIDLVVDQGPQGVECVPGNATFVYNGNWKLQMENGVDPYHFASTHPSYIQALQRRQEKDSVYSRFRSAELRRGTFSFRHGHNALWGPAPPGRVGPLDAVLGEIQARVGPAVANWMTMVRNATFFPNAQLADNASIQLRIWRPLGPERTEVRTFCLAPVGESQQARQLRIRQYEEFFNPTGLATPDDIANYEDCQRGFQARSIRWQQGHVRGSGVRSAQGDPELNRELGIEPVSTAIGPFDMGDETVMHETYRCWRRLIDEGRRRARASQEPAT